MSEKTSPASSPAETGGVFITLEGVDGAGKSTQCALLCQALELAGRDVVRLREPGGTRLGEKIRPLLLASPEEEAAEPMAPMAELMLYEAARAQLVARVVGPALARGAAVVSDRFFDSTLAYQGTARGIGEGIVRQLSALACGDVVPSRTVVLDLDPAQALARAVGEAGPDRLEGEGVAFERRVREGFLSIAQAEPDRVRVVSALGTPAEVYARMAAQLADLVELPTYEQVKGAAHGE